jgi:lipoprotein Spr
MRRYALSYTILTIAAALLLNGCASSRHANSSEPLNSSANRQKEIRTKYATILQVDEVNVTNYTLYAFIDRWYGAPYHYGGHELTGVDCSAFTCILYQQVYGLELSGPAGDLYNQCEKVKVSDLKEGDLVFFRINSKNISHVGVYLQNNKFVHASVHSGVVIDDLSEAYYKKYFYKAGRLLKA